jgi:trehalose 2-sulfotransferase
VGHCQSARRQLQLRRLRAGGARRGQDPQRGVRGQRFVYLRRSDVLAQAVSWLRAEQTGVWFQTGQRGEAQPGREPRFDFGRIRELARMIGEHNGAWRNWFASAGIQPHQVGYEDLDADPVGVTRGILGFLGLELPLGREISAGHTRLADELNAEWIERYRVRMARSA